MESFLEYVKSRSSMPVLRLILVFNLYFSEQFGIPNSYYLSLAEVKQILLLSWLPLFYLVLNLGYFIWSIYFLREVNCLKDLLVLRVSSAFYLLDKFNSSLLICVSHYSLSRWAYKGFNTIFPFSLFNSNIFLSISESIFTIFKSISLFLVNNY